MKGEGGGGGGACDDRLDYFCSLQKVNTALRTYGMRSGANSPSIYLDEIVNLIEITLNLFFI